ncbi:MAG: hypothetical protein R3B40_22585 [Polyangiales bacterium]|nr:hypothetical protein [Myxococcales bacterium]
MHHHHRLPITFPLSVFLVACVLLGCEEDATPALAEGETFVSLELSGDVLTSPLRFEGTTESVSEFVSDDITLLAGNGLGIPSAQGGYELGVMTMTVRLDGAGAVDQDGFDINLVVHGFSDSAGNEAFSLRERPGASLTVSTVTADRIVMHFAFDASPTQLNNTERVFHIEGRLELRR